MCSILWEVLFFKELSTLVSVNGDHHLQEPKYFLVAVYFETVTLTTMQV